MSNQLTAGNVTILPVSDTGIGGSPAYMFPQVSAEQWEPYRHWMNERGNFRMNIGTFVLRSGGRTMLVDTGLGDKPRAGYPQGALLANLAAAGIMPDDVDIVLCTHLHIDHVGWNTVRKGDAWVPAFPRARYIIARTEWEYWTAPERAATIDYVQDSVLPLADTGQLDLVEETHRVTSEITLVPAPGHTPAHVCVAIVSGGERAMIIGDMAHHPVQLTETEWSVAFDLDPRQAAVTRAALVEQMERDGSLVLGGHFPFPGLGRLVRLGERRSWQAL